MSDLNVLKTMQDPIFSVEQLVAATNNFSQDNFLGKGGFGEVFKGHIFGTPIAVKRLNEGRDVRHFRMEAELLARLRHPYIVLLMGCTPDGRCIVSELMAGGSLHDRLKASADPPSCAPLTWKDRIRISSEMASALAYMHSLGVLHRDLKPANVLLDRNKVSKLSDVGLAKRLKPGESSTGKGNWKIQGTAGYIDPHHIKSGQATKETDIYSLGLVFLQLITGICKIQEIHNILMKHGSTAPRGELVSVFQENLDKNAGEWDENIARKILHLALKCTERSPDLRPNLEHLQPELQRLVMEVEGMEAVSFSKMKENEISAKQAKGDGKSKIAWSAPFRKKPTPRLGRSKSLPTSSKLVGTPERAILKEAQAHMKALLKSQQGGDGHSPLISTDAGGNQQMASAVAENKSVNNRNGISGNFISGSLTGSMNGANDAVGAVFDSEGLYSPPAVFKRGGEGTSEVRDLSMLRSSSVQDSSDARPFLVGRGNHLHLSLESLGTGSSRSALRSPLGTSDLSVGISSRFNADAMIIGVPDRSMGTENVWNMSRSPSVMSDARGEALTPPGSDIVSCSRRAGWIDPEEDKYGEAEGDKHPSVNDWTSASGPMAIGALGVLEDTAARRVLTFASQNLHTDARKALRLLNIAADQGHAEAENTLGLFFFEGKGVPQSYTEAVYMFRRAARKGNAAAECNLGCCYLAGKGVKENKIEAVTCFRSAAKAGYALAQTIMGVCCLKGYVDSEKGSKEAVEWFNKAANQVDANAQTHLAACYSEGRLVPKDDGMAFRYWELAAQQGHPVAVNGLGACYQAGKGVKQSHQQAIRLYKVAAEMGQTSAQLYLGGYYYDGVEIEQNFLEAVDLFRLAIAGCEKSKLLKRSDTEDEVVAVRSFSDSACALQPSDLMDDFWNDEEDTLSKAHYFLGVCYANAHGVHSNYLEAARLYRLAADEGNGNAMYDLGVLYDKGRGVEKNLGQAVRRWRQAADKGHSLAQFNLAICLENGEGVAVNLVEAALLYRLAAVSGLPQAKFHLGLCYYQGKGTQRDTAEAFRWLNEAAEDGFPDAQRKREELYCRGPTGRFTGRLKRFLSSRVS